MGAEEPVTRAELQAALDETKDDLKSFMRQIETNMLTAFHSYSQGMTARLHTMDTVDSELRIRMAALEDRVLALETRRSQ